MSAGRVKRYATVGALLCAPVGFYVLWGCWADLADGMSAEHLLYGLSYLALLTVPVGYALYGVPLVLGALARLALPPAGAAYAELALGLAWAFVSVVGNGAFLGLVCGAFVDGVASARRPQRAPE